MERSLLSGKLSVVVSCWVNSMPLRRHAACRLTELCIPFDAVSWQGVDTRKIVVIFFINNGRAKAFGLSILKSWHNVNRRIFRDALTSRSHVAPQWVPLFPSLLLLQWSFSLLKKHRRQPINQLSLV